MAMTIAMRIGTRILFFDTEVTQGPVLSARYAHTKRIPKSRCVFRSGFEDTTIMSPHSTATGRVDLAGDRTDASYFLGIY